MLSYAAMNAASTDFIQAETAPIASIVLIDDCPDFRRIMTSYAQKYNINLKSYASLAEMYTFAHLKNFDLALIDFHLESLCGIEIANYVDIFFDDLPVVLVSGDSLQESEEWPKCIKGFIEKKWGPNLLLQRSLEILERHRLYRMLEKKAFTQNVVHS